MDIAKFLKEVTALPGLPGYEDAAAAYIRGCFEPYADEIRIGALGSVIARVGTEGPRVIVCAHQDEIGLVITKIEDDGCLRITCTGGVDPRILPAHEVRVLAKDGPLYGVIGAKPPHLTNPKDREKALEMESLFVDIGYDAEKARKLVQVGDMCQLIGPTQALAGDRLTGKTMDDRAGVASVIVLAEELSRMRAPAQVFLVATSQEETSFGGATTATYDIDPDFGIAVDVTHGEGPGTGKYEAFPLDKPTIAVGPNLHPMLTKRLMETAKRIGVPYEKEIVPGYSGTDAVPMQISRLGVPSVLVSIPLKYMHTTVETLSVDAVRLTGRLMAGFIDDVARDWGNLKWY